ncbi:MAG: 50S ribosomal protein L18 [Candidatus Riflebacteria bacterium]|nr:50S ribosomal protein L18 [Candidatus Riflebacteria bacterium]
MGHTNKMEEARVRRHVRVRRKVKGTAERPRLVVFRSSKHMYAQLVNDEDDKTIGGVSTLSPPLRERCASLKGLECAKVVGEAIAALALEKSITQVVYDRGGFAFLGKVKALADAARAKGLKF